MDEKEEVKDFIEKYNDIGKLYKCTSLQQLIELYNKLKNKEIWRK